MPGCPNSACPSRSYSAEPRAAARRQAGVGSPFTRTANRPRPQPRSSICFRAQLRAGTDARSPVNKGGITGGSGAMAPPQPATRVGYLRSGRKWALVLAGSGNADLTLVSERAGGRGRAGARSVRRLRVGLVRTRRADWLFVRCSGAARMVWTSPAHCPVRRCVRVAASPPSFSAWSAGVPSPHRRSRPRGDEHRTAPTWLDRVAAAASLARGRGASRLTVLSPASQARCGDSPAFVGVVIPANDESGSVAASVAARRAASHPALMLARRRRRHR